MRCLDIDVGVRGGWIVAVAELVGRNKFLPSSCSNE